MKMQEEFNQFKQGDKTLGNNLNELSDDELKVVGGSASFWLDY